MDQQQSNPSLFGYGTPPVDPWINELTKAAQDPRIAMILAPYSGLLKFPGFAQSLVRSLPRLTQRGSFSPSMSGGANVPESAMRQADIPAPVTRDKFLESVDLANTRAGLLAHKNPAKAEYAYGMLSKMPLKQQDTIIKTLDGKAELQDYVKQRMSTGFGFDQ